jgi:hypothetical protein
MVDAHCILQEIEIFSCNTELSSNQIASSILWHHRLGHLQYKSLYTFSLGKRVKGLPILAHVDHFYE